MATHRLDIDSSRSIQVGYPLQVVQMYNARRIAMLAGAEGTTISEQETTGLILLSYLHSGKRNFRMSYCIKRPARPYISKRLAPRHSNV